MDLGELWSAGGILVGFQVTALTFRVNREVSVARAGDLTWLPVADCLNMLSLSFTLVGVFILPVLDIIGEHAAGTVFGFAVLLLLGYAFALAGHYEMLDPRTRRSMAYFPVQERWVVAGVGLAAAAYIVVAVFT